ncbi:MAG: glycosyltransferase [Verrucomicrobiaceae bacterium]
MNFSVITPSFQNSEWLRLCVASVADQQGVAFEHIVQDAGSTDGTLDWLPSDARVKAFVEKDAGMYDGINRGLGRASGEILAYLNCDEQYLPHALARVHRLFSTHPHIEVLFTDALLLDRACNPISYRRVVLPSSRHIRLRHLNTLSCATFFRRSVIEKGHFFNPQWKAIGDAIWVDGLLQARIPMACLREQCSAYAFTGSNLGQTASSRKEHHRWQPSRHFIFEAAILVIHRLRKALAGAYMHRTVNADLYTMKSPEERVQFRGVKLGFDWPVFHAEK